MNAEYIIENNIEVVEPRSRRGHYLISLNKDQKAYFWSFRRLRLVGYDEAWIAEEGLTTDQGFALSVARTLAGSPSSMVH